MRAGHLDGLAELDALAIDLDIELILDGVGDHGRGHGTEQDALVADLGVDGDLLAIEARLERVGVLETDRLALGDVVAALLELLQVARSCRNGEFLREKVVLGVSLSDIYDIALAALALDLTKKNDFHEIS